MFKTCTCCGEEKLLDEFYRHARGLFGCASRCKKCQIASAARWNRENKERRAISHKRHRDKTKEINKERSRIWREKNPGRNYEAVKDWVKRNPEKVKLYSAARCYRAKNAPGVCTVEQLQARIDFYAGLCWMCGSPAGTIDHVIPLAGGGSHWPSNLRPACKSCNSRKGAKRVYVD